MSDGIIFVRLGIAEINEHTVAHAFRNKSGKAAHRIGDAAMIGAHDLAQILGIEARRQRRRADQVAKHHGELAPLGFGRRRAGEHRWRIMGDGMPGTDRQISNRS